MPDVGPLSRSGPDEIILSPASPGDLCSSLEHRRARRLAQVIVTLGQMGTADQHRAALWLEAWGRSYTLCSPCWDATRQVAQARRPGLVITDTTRTLAR